jgi:hypothetical protein
MSRRPTGRRTFEGSRGGACPAWGTNRSPRTGRD